MYIGWNQHKYMPQYDFYKIISYYSQFKKRIVICPLHLQRYTNKSKCGRKIILKIRTILSVMKVKHFGRPTSQERVWIQV